MTTLYPRLIRFKDFYQYSDDKKWTTEGGTNWADILDALVRYAAKYTDSYASDLFRCYEYLKEKVSEYYAFADISPSSVIICFRENAIDFIGEDYLPMEFQHQKLDAIAIFKFDIWIENGILKLKLERVRHHIPDKIYYKIDCRTKERVYCIYRAFDNFCRTVYEIADELIQECYETCSPYGYGTFDAPNMSVPENYRIYIYNFEEIEYSEYDEAIKAREITGEDETEEYLDLEDKIFREKADKFTYEERQKAD